MKKAWVSLLVTGSPSDWVQHSELYHDDDLVEQPVGQVDLYLSDLVSLAGVPTAFCRPSTVELAAGVTRNPTITITFERLRAIFRKARHLHNPTKFTTEATDQEQNPYEEAERRVAEERSEAERRVAEERSEAERRVAETRSEARIEIERRVAEARIEMERRVAEERSEAERRVAEARSEARIEIERLMAEGRLGAK
ncbi:hypothetical protein QC762_507410 [Podospora pseudocomata]|uniref:Uncharacterized protein n=1 Tax=Podospora pseudocomata TaxID=2093779 RepID=A0ABR0GC87_9PEZI|nr:hypothetical protein QC762_507410 [Podospora pseudocomata]